MKTNKKILILLITTLFLFLTMQMVSAQNSAGENEESEINRMARELEEEREKLLKLEAEFDEKGKEGKEKSSEMQQISEISTDINEVDGETEDDLYNELQDIRPAIDEENVLEDTDNQEEDFFINREKISEIINPFEIAENLYKLGEYELALDIYEVLGKKSTENNKVLWITFQSANCYRKMKVYNKALALYRKLQKENEGTYWASQAKWYISEVEWRTEVQDKLELIE